MSEQRTGRDGGVAIDAPSGSPRTPSRRALLLGAIGALGASAAAALGRAAPVLAADGEVVNVGDDLTGTKTTSFTVNTTGYSALWGNSTDGSGAGVGVRGDTSSWHPISAGVYGVGTASNGVRGVGFNGVVGEGERVGVSGEGKTAGVYGSSDGGYGVWGYAVNGPGVMGESVHDAAVAGLHGNFGTGVMGYCKGEDVPPPAPKAKTGVFGESKVDASSRGVWGISSAGHGIRGEATTGVGVYGAATSAGGYAFRGSGRVRFDKVCGVATIAANTTSLVITPGTDVTADSFVLLTPGADIGTRRLWFTKDTSANTITIRMSSSRTSSTAVSWLLLR